MKTNSIWKKTVEIPGRSPLTKDIKTDACIIGGGMAGILTALKFRENGIDAVVLEANKIGSGQTGNTTAKITSQHGLKYTHLVEHFGKTQAIEYARANTLAIDEYEKIIAASNIDCDFIRMPSYLYSLEENNKLRE